MSTRRSKRFTTDSGDKPSAVSPSPKKRPRVEPEQSPARTTRSQRSTRSTSLTEPAPPVQSTTQSPKPSPSKAQKSAVKTTTTRQSKQNVPVRSTRSSTSSNTEDGRDAVPAKGSPASLPKPPQTKRKEAIVETKSDKSKASTPVVSSPSRPVRSTRLRSSASENVQQKEIPTNSNISAPLQTKQAVQPNTSETSTDSTKQESPVPNSTVSPSSKNYVSETPKDGPWTPVKTVKHVTSAQESPSPSKQKAGGRPSPRVNEKVKPSSDATVETATQSKALVEESVTAKANTEISSSPATPVELVKPASQIDQSPKSVPGSPEGGGTPRRTARKRMPSKRFADMEVDLASSGFGGISSVTDDSSVKSTNKGDEKTITKPAPSISFKLMEDGNLQMITTHQTQDESKKLAKSLLPSSGQPRTVGPVKEIVVKTIKPVQPAKPPEPVQVITKQVLPDVTTDASREKTDDNKAAEEAARTTELLQELSEVISAISRREQVAQKLQETTEMAKAQDNVVAPTEFPELVSEGISSTVTQIEAGPDHSYQTSAEDPDDVPQTEVTDNAPQTQTLSDTTVLEQAMPDTGDAVESSSKDMEVATVVVEKQLAQIGPGDEISVVVSNLGMAKDVVTLEGTKEAEAGDGAGCDHNSMYVDIMVKDGQYYFKCSDCEYSTLKKGNFQKHRRIHRNTGAPNKTAQRPFSCDQCDYRATTSSNLKRHMMQHTDKRRFPCTECEMTFKQKIHLQRHIKYRHEERKIACPFCDYMCANANPDLRQHIKRKHTEKQEETTKSLFMCDNCTFTTHSKKDLRQHSKFHRKGPELKFYCDQCSFVTDASSRLHRHTMIHTKEKPFACGLCNYKASQREHVYRHMRTKHDILVQTKSRKKSAVDEASQASAEEAAGPPSEVGEEVLVNTTPAKRKYEPADFSDKEKLFACSYCSMKFHKLLNLYKHVHTMHRDVHPSEDSGNFQCIVCDFTTTRKKNLLVHMRRHSVIIEEDVDPCTVYSCMLCDYKNILRRNLYQHMKKRHRISIIVKKDGTASCIVEDPSAVTIVTPEDGSSMKSGSLAIAHDPQTNEDRTVKLQDLANSLMIKKRPVIAMTSLLNNQNQASSRTLQSGAVVHYETVEAIQGLQALAGDVIIDSEPVPQPTQVVQTQPEKGASVHVGESDKNPNIQLSADQLMHLSSGDYIEINGEMYKVEFTKFDDDAGEGKTTGNETTGKGYSVQAESGSIQEISMTVDAQQNVIEISNAQAPVTDSVGVVLTDSNEINAEQMEIEDTETQESVTALQENS